MSVPLSHVILLILSRSSARLISVTELQYGLLSYLYSTRFLFRIFNSFSADVDKSRHEGPSAEVN